MDQILRQQPSDVPFVPKVTIIGPKGSGRFVVASALSKRFNLVNGRFYGGRERHSKCKLIKPWYSLHDIINK